MVAIPLGAPRKSSSVRTRTLDTADRRHDDLRERIGRWMETEVEYVGRRQLVRAPDTEADVLAVARRLRDELSTAGGQLLRPEQETLLFRTMNLLKHHAVRAQRTLSLTSPNRSTVERLETLLQAATQLRNRIVEANVRLVVSVAKKFATSRLPLGELISDGNVTLLRAVEKFDFSRGFRFSTYATWALRYNFARAVGKKPTAFNIASNDGEAALEAVDYRPDPSELRTQSIRHRALRQMLERLDPRERAIVSKRYGLIAGEDERSLQELSSEMGICKERVRQLQMRALEKLREAARRYRLEDSEA